MQLIRPFRGVRPNQNKAGEILGPPYDTLSVDEARSRSAGKPNSFLHVSRAEIDLPLDINVYSPQVYAKARENYDRLKADELLIRDDQPCYYLYRQVMGSHSQTGLVAVASVAAYDEGRVKKHEHTQPKKETDRVNQIVALEAQTGPVLHAFRHDPAISKLLEPTTDPVSDVVTDDDVRHTLWLVDDPTKIKAITEAFNNLEAIYIADGHHRSAAASRVAKQFREERNHREDHDSQYFLSVIFPDHELQILDYNRLILDLNDHSTDEFHALLENSFSIEPSSGPVAPQTRGEFGMYMEGTWSKLTLKPALMPTDILERLDVNILENLVLRPVLGIEDQRTNPRIDFVGGIRGLKELQDRVDRGDAVLAFSFFATSAEDLFAVADAGEVMPTKSTWFEPKLADGMVSHEIG
ncbi:MAG: DUF1015 domain-containing protein [Candidatus Eisenbacteria bacterium]|uniref:DUF1015 domain-containing protein n=1 Tax=Eiseniibacteriota bacterium TaxID=2212470 RepID=A0A7Y2ECG0_UNCEI|nr:DUF1015 domain-containing protein [Candidatus Eisenbacteria bacterium]